MSEANEGPTVVVVTPSAEAPEGSSNGGQVAGPETAEVVTDAAVQIAEINAGRDIALAEIANEGDAARAEAYANEELEQCRNRIAELEGLNSGLMAEVETLKALIPPPPSPEPLPSPPAPPPSPEKGEAEPALEPAASPAPAEEPPPPKRRAIRWT